MVLPNLSRVLVLFSLIVVFVSAAMTQTHQHVVVRGRVLDRNRAAIPGATVSVSAPGLPSLTTTTNQLGEYSFSLPQANYQITATADGFVDTSEAIRLGEAALEHDLILQIAAAGAFVTITDTAGYGIPSLTSATKTPTL